MTGWVQTSAPIDAWNSVASNSTGQNLVAAYLNNFDGSYIFTSTDAGSNWINQGGNAPSNGLPDTYNDGSLSCIALASNSIGQNLVALFSGSTTNGVYTSTNGGSLWTLQMSGLPNPNTLVNWSSVASDSTGQNLVACINYGGIYISTNGGSSWTLQTNDLPAIGSWLAVASNADGTRLVAIIANSIYTYLNGVWSNSNDAPTNLNWGAVASDSTGQNLILAPSNGFGINYIYTSTNFGANWVQKSIPLSLFISSVASDSTGQKLVVVGTYSTYAYTPGGIILSEDGGTTWTQTDANPSFKWSAVASNSDGNKLVATRSGGDDGAIYTYTPPYPCFKEGSKILTDQGYKLIQDLRKGDLVKTLLHGFKPIDMIGYREIVHSVCKERIKDQLYQCSQEEYSEIFEPLVLTGCHSILVDEFVSREEREKTIEVNGNTYVTDRKYRLPACVDERTKVYKIAGTYTIYHLALENDDYYMNYGIYANGLLVESCSKRYLKELSNMKLIE